MRTLRLRVAMREVEPLVERVIDVPAAITLDELHEVLQVAIGCDRSIDQHATTQRVRDAVGAVPDSVRLVLDLLADGVKLTPGGRLPRSVVRAVQQVRPGWNPMGRLASIEEDVLSLAVLHDLLRHVRLVRLTNGVLRPTKAAADELETVRRLRSWFDEGAFHTMAAERAVALVAVRGPLQVAEIAAEVHPLLGHGWSRGGKPIATRDVEDELHGTLLWRTSFRPWTSSPAADQNGPRDHRLARCYPARTCSPTCSDRLPLGDQ